MDVIKGYPEEMLLLRDALSKIKDIQPIISKAFKGLVLEDKDFFLLEALDINYSTDDINI